jgi:transcriptional regulator with XRE-family HTH domain
MPTIPESSLSLGETIRRARLAKKWSLREFAKVLEVTPSYVSDIDHDRRVPSEHVLKAIALLLDLDEARLMVKAGRLYESTERYVEDHPVILALIEAIAWSELRDEEVERLIRIVKRKTEGSES